MATRTNKKTVDTNEVLTDELVASNNDIKADSNNTSTKTITKRKQKERIPGETMIECQNLTMNRLVYISTRQNGYKVVWSNPGDVEEIELSELMTMRNSQPRFFSDNWIGIDREIQEYLGVDKYYDNAPNFDDYDRILTLPFDEMKVAISKLPKGMMDSFALKANEMIENGMIDSIKAVKYLSEAFNLILDD